MIPLTLAGLLGSTACGGSTPISSEPAASAACDESSSCLRFDPDVPLLQLAAVCYGACAFVDPLGLPDVILYGDGRVVRTSHALPDPRPTFRTGQVPADRVAELAAQARDAGLAGGIRTTLGFRQVSFADGGGDVLTSILDGKQTTVESPQSYDATLDSDSTDPAGRAALRALAEALRSLAAEAPYEDARVVLRATPSPYADGQPVPWTGPRLTDLPNDGSGRCIILEGEPARVTLAAVAQDAFPTVYAEGGREFRVAARPTLPHERTCAEVEETVRLSTV